MSNNGEYFKKYCEVTYDFLKREDRENPAIKSIIRYVVREACNHCSDLPGYDNKLGAEMVSALAEKQIAAGGNLAGLVGEHVVPVSVINKKLLELPASRLSIEEISITVKELSKRAVITKDEDQKLRQKQLSKKMPNGWKWDGHNEMARYAAVGIETLQVSYKEVVKKAKENLQ